MEFANVNMLILLVVTFLVTAGIKGLGAMLGKDLAGVQAGLTAGIVGLVLGIWNSVILPLIPAAYLPLIEPIANSIVVILGAFGVHKVYKSFQAVSNGASGGNSKAQGMVEYALILVLVAVVVIAAMTIMGPLISNIFESINASL